MPRERSAAAVVAVSCACLSLVTSVACTGRRAALAPIAPRSAGPTGAVAGGGPSPTAAAYPTPVPTSASCDFPEPDQAAVQAWLTGGCYLDWPHDPEIRSSGPLVEVDGQTEDDSTHHRVRIYYSPGVVAWLNAGRPATGIPDGEAIVKEMYPTSDAGADADTLLGYSAILKYQDRSHDGWFWSIYFLNPGSMAPMGAFGYSFCLTCHGSADNRELTFADLSHLEGSLVEPQETITEPNQVRLTTSHSQGWLDVDDEAVLPVPLAAPDPDFVAQFPQLAQPAQPMALAFPSSGDDHLPVGPNGPDQFLTSGNCMGCHDASLLMDPQTPNMLVKGENGTDVNVSPYGEWHASLMGLAGRDPVFHAQLESEKALRPSETAFLDDTCYRCHGVMGLRQLEIDQGRPFQHDMVYAEPGTPNGKYGILARDGVSCTVCHHIAPEGLGTPETYTGHFNVGLATELYGPFTDVLPKPMQNALGITPRAGDQIRSAALCGSCHTVILPRLPTEEDPAATDPYANRRIPKGHEQSTYLEWRNSSYQNEREPVDASAAQTCQGCHMPTTYAGPDDAPLAFRIANIEDASYPPVPNRLPDADLDLPVRRPYARHTLVGLNEVVMQMFQQQSDLLGVALRDPYVPNDTMASLLLASQESRKLGRRSANVALEAVRRRGGALEATVVVTNLAGHKLPSGVGFRRAYLDFQVLDAAGKVLWASGRTSPLGVILGPDDAPLVTEFSPDRTEIQPHHDLITSQDQVQVYEDRYLDSDGHLTTSFIGLAEEVKDNRLLPRGWSTTAPDTDFLQPSGINGDPRYADGSGTDAVQYRIPLTEVPGAARITVGLYYQSIPPYYLNERFDTASGPETTRLYYIASHLNLADTAVAGWRMQLAEASARLP
jgi:hypothetical protein